MWVVMEGNSTSMCKHGVTRALTNLFTLWVSFTNSSDVIATTTSLSTGPTLIQVISFKFVLVSTSKIYQVLFTLKSLKKEIKFQHSFFKASRKILCWKLCNWIQLNLPKDLLWLKTNKLLDLKLKRFILSSPENWSTFKILLSAVTKMTVFLGNFFSLHEGQYWTYSLKNYPTFGTVLDPCKLKLVSIYIELIKQNFKPQ